MIKNHHSSWFCQYICDCNKHTYLLRTIDLYTTFSLALTNGSTFGELLLLLYLSSLTVGRNRIRSVVIDFVSRVLFFFPMAPSQAQSGRRACWAAHYTLFGAKMENGGRYHQERTLVWPAQGLRRNNRLHLRWSWSHGQISPFVPSNEGK